MDAQWDEKGNGVCGKGLSLEDACREVARGEKRDAQALESNPEASDRAHKKSQISDQSYNHPAIDQVQGELIEAADDEEFYIDLILENEKEYKAKSGPQCLSAVLIEDDDPFSKEGLVVEVWVQRSWMFGGTGLLKFVADECVSSGLSFSTEGACRAAFYNALLRLEAYIKELSPAPAEGLRAPELRLNPLVHDVDLYLKRSDREFAVDDEGLGLASSVAFVAYLADLRVQTNVGALGCVTLTGKVSPVNNVAFKLEALGAHAKALRMKSFTVLLPKDNVNESGNVVETNGTCVRVSAAVHNVIKVIPVETVFDALKIVFQPGQVPPNLGQDERPADFKVEKGRGDPWEDMMLARGATFTGIDGPYSLQDVEVLFLPLLVDDDSDNEGPVRRRQSVTKMETVGLHQESASKRALVESNEIIMDRVMFLRREWKRLLQTQELDQHIVDKHKFMIEGRKIVVQLPGMPSKDKPALTLAYVAAIIAYRTDLRISEKTVFIGEVYGEDGKVRLSSTCSITQADLAYLRDKGIKYLVVPASSEDDIDLLGDPGLNIYYVSAIQDLLSKIFLQIILDNYQIEEDEEDQEEGEEDQEEEEEEEEDQEEGEGDQGEGGEGEGEEEDQVEGE